MYLAENALVDYLCGLKFEGFLNSTGGRSTLRQLGLVKGTFVAFIY